MSGERSEPDTIPDLNTKPKSNLRLNLRRTPIGLGMVWTYPDKNEAEDFIASIRTIFLLLFHFSVVKVKVYAGLPTKQPMIKVGGFSIERFTC